MSLELLKKKISEIISLNKEDIELIETFFKPMKIEKNVLLMEPGKTVRYAFFVNSGYIRYYKVADSGEELTIHLYAQNNFAASLNSFFSGLPSDEFMQTLTDCELLAISKDDLERLYSTNQKWQYFGRKLMEIFLIEKEQRIIDQISLTGQQKYLKLQKTSPEIIQNVQVKYIASFLGLQPESLSRIKKTFS